MQKEADGVTLQKLQGTAVEEKMVSAEIELKATISPESLPDQINSCNIDLEPELNPSDAIGQSRSSSLQKRHEDQLEPIQIYQEEAGAKRLWEIFPDKEKAKHGFREREKDRTKIE